MRAAKVSSLGAAFAGLMIMLAVAIAAAAQPRGARSPALVLEIDGAIGPATTEYIRDGLATADGRGAPILILRMDTPGGLDSATRDIISAILASRTPVATFVAPAGARAASAGTYILYASHLAAMAPGTHLGAATPVQMGGGGGPLPGGAPPKGDEAQKGGSADAMTAKAVNDAAAYMASLAALHGRNAEWAERAVREAATLTAEQALAQGVIEVRAGDVSALLAQAHGREVRLAGGEAVLDLAGVRAETLPPGWRIRALSVITNPNVAYLLLIIGFYGLLFEFMSPGGVGPGVFGAVALLVALFALNLLPVNYAGLGLLILGVALMAVEAATPSVGALGVAGAIAFAIGSLFLFKGPLPEFRVAPQVVFVAAGLSLAFFVLALGAVARARRTVRARARALSGVSGRVLSWSADRGLVHVNGEDWQACAAEPLAPGEPVRVVGRSGVILNVEPASGPTEISDPV